MKEQEPTVQRAAMRDGPQIQELVNRFASRGEMLPRSLAEIYENIRDFSVVRAGDRVVACVALHIMWSSLAEVRSLAVAEEAQSQGLGQKLVDACIEEGRRLGLTTIFALTYRPGFFERLGFRQADVMHLPHKVWNECYRCPKFPTCDEVAMILEVDTAAPVRGDVAEAIPA